jgi:type IV secretory pathway TrbD component
MAAKKTLAPVDGTLIERTIYLVRGQKVMLDRDLAALYGVDTKALKQAVRRNLKRFPPDFMFLLAPEELTKWRSQFVTSNSDRMGLRHAPMAFAEQGVAMLSGLLNSDRAIEVNIAVMRTFVRLRRMLEIHEELARKLAELESKYDGQFRAVFEALDALMVPPEPERRPIGFAARERGEVYRVTRVDEAVIEETIYLIRGQKVILDRDLAALYGVDTKALKQAVRRNLKRFPPDFMFVLDRKEFVTLRSQFVTSKTDPRGGTQYAPMAFTEQGVAMLSSVLKSERAIEVNIAVMRTFVRLRRMLEVHEELARRLAELESKYDGQFRVLMAPPEPERKPIGFSRG